MRIISKYKDYYDSASGFGVDTSVVYSRQEKMLDGRSDSQDYQQYNDILAACEKMTHRDHFQNMYIHSNYDRVYVGVAGKIYVGLKFRVQPEHGKEVTLFEVIDEDRPWDEIFAWTPENLTDKQLDTSCRKEPWVINQKGNTPREWFTNNATNRVVENIDLFTKHDMVSFVALDTEVRASRGGPRVYVDPRLLDFGFQRLMDGFTLFQEISMFVTGVLATKDQMTYVPTDKELLYARGHDDMSFKTPPTKKR